MPSHSYEFDLTFPIEWGEPGFSHRKFNYFFDDDYGFCFGPCDYTPPTPAPSLWHLPYDLMIYYGAMGASDFVGGWCSRWAVQN